ncbi:hypothetical protein MIMGU_mgv1a009495mg [Erythranthe guttata]|uniref:Cytochrome b561 domain-containing protein n=1 Tax=Erythranthe guttata TaxID=4155 RepID=A0A022RFV4_ERYGU|nr:hypothetical protein MIMGU_mgv1a009495mg [Erythranthe guttata]
MEECPKFLLSKSSFLLFSVLVTFINSALVAQGADIENPLCNTDLTSFLPFPYGTLPNMICKPLWNSYLLRGFTPSEIKPDQGELPLTNSPPFVALNGATIYLAFQLQFNKTLKNQPILLAFSTKTPHHHRLTVHDDKTTLNFDFSSGKTDHSRTDFSASIFKDRRTHGTLALLGWGLFLPIGAILARYLKHKDSLWYYLHVAFQFIGFLLGIGAVVVGISLNNKMHASIPAHKGIGIFVLVITVLQVLAFITRPSKDSKYRRYWNWYHNWVGRICLFFGAVNIVMGIQIAGEGQSWKIGYGFLVGSILVIVIVLETLLRIRKVEEREKLAAFSIQQEISL